MSLELSFTPADQIGKIQRTIEESFAEAAKEASWMNDVFKLPTPVYRNGKIHHVLKPPLLKNPGRSDIPIKDLLGDDPWMWLVAGPNGAGKKTFSRVFLKGASPYPLLHLSPDGHAAMIRSHLSNKSWDDALKIATQRIDELVSLFVKQRQSFLVETPLSSSKYQDAVLLAKKDGFQIGLVYISLPLADLLPARIHLRVQKGGHPVDPQKAKDSFARSLDQLPWFAEQADFFMAFDNAAQSREPILVAMKKAGSPLVHKNSGINPKLDRALKKIAPKRNKRNALVLS
ncbi:MAG: zeta toxin family protein [Alphaproteobacteria bacterium]|nr:zeta toxin family protein [Alphaproteobacteria bacterium]